VADRAFLVTITGEPYQPARLHCRLFDKGTVEEATNRSGFAQEWQAKPADGTAGREKKMVNVASGGGPFHLLDGGTMPINNEIYEIYGHGWWAEDAAFDFSSLRYCVNPVRYGFFKRILGQLPAPGETVLDVGCGGGFLAEEFARDGFTVTGIDPAARSVDAARQHAAEHHLSITYRVGRGEALPFPDGAFDIVACCDVLEHVDDLALVVSEVARTLKAGGVFFYDTVNRTWLSKLLLIKIWQDWGLIRSSHPNVHVWEKFIKPAELVAHMSRHRLVSQQIRGIALRSRNPLVLLASLRALRRRKFAGHEMAAALALGETNDLTLSYMGYAIRQ